MTGGSVIGDRSFLRLWIGTTAPGLATWALPFVLGLAVVDGTLSATGLGIILATRTVGFVAAVPFAGVLADRYSRRSVVWWSSLFAAVAAALIAVGLGRSVLLMACAAVVFGAGSGACRPAFQALTAEVVGPDHRQAANAAISLGVRVSVLSGPGLAALLAVFFGSGALVAGIGALWIAAAIVPPPGSRIPPGESGRPSFAAEFSDGLREARRHPWFVSGLLALTAVIFAGYSATGVALPLVSRDGFGGGFVLAAALTAYTAGALFGAVIIARWRPKNQGWTALASLSLYGLAPLSLMFSVHSAVIIAAYAIVGLGIELFNVPWFTATQREVAPHLLARVSSLDFLVSYGLAPVGLALIAPAIAAFGLQPVLAFCALVCFFSPTVAALVPSARHFSISRHKSPAESGQ